MRDADSYRRALERAAQDAVQLLMDLTPAMEYLRDELTAHVDRLDELLLKMRHEEALQRDREFLLADTPSDGIGEHLGSSDG